jgi:hypothetical protein
MTASKKDVDTDEDWWPTEEMESDHENLMSIAAQTVREHPITEQDANSGGWQVIETEWGDRHIIPVDDLRPHIPRATCWCGPCPDADDSSVIIHDAVDGRE